MPPSDADPSATVAYSLDKWRMDRLPWGLWGVAIGLAIVLNVPGKGAGGALHAIVYLAALGVVFAGTVGLEILERMDRPFYIEFPAFMVVAVIVTVVVAAIVGIVGGAVGSYEPGPWWRRLVDPPFDVFGWMLLYMGAIWIAYLLWRHTHPERPVVLLSPAGISMHRQSWLHNVTIPWADVQQVGELDFGGTWVSPSQPRPAVAVVTREFYERHIEPKIGVLAPPGYEMTFRAKGETLMQVVLASRDLDVAPRDLRAPLEARWKVFHTVPRAAADTPSQADVVHGLWSWDGSRGQTIKFAAPAVVLAAVLLHAGFWPH